MTTGEQLELLPRCAASSADLHLEDELAAQLNRAATEVTRAVVIKERACHVGKSKGHCADPELIGAVKVVLIGKER